MSIQNLESVQKVKGWEEKEDEYVIGGREF